MSRELAEVIEENGIVYHLGEHDLYYPDLGLPEETDYNIGKYGIMRWEYMKANHKAEYFHLYLDGRLNEYLHEIDEECHARGDLLVEQMKAGAGITEGLKADCPMEWIRLMNNVRNAAEEIVLREMIYV